ncbi:MAG TPA: steroid 3-ketoacyl-CoA thiolase [Acidimicrobiales bacterium]|jgi:acetyl-CoA C-acetyltransferase
MGDVVIVEAVRSAIGRRNGGLSTVHPVDLLGKVLTAAVERAGIDPAQVEQLVGGCVSSAGEQAFNVARTAWLSAGLPISTAATTVDSQCGSSQQATGLAAGLVAGGAADVVIACGIESMSRVGMGATMMNGPGSPFSASYPFEMASQFEGAERIATKWSVTRADTDALGLSSQQRAAQAWAEGRFEREVVPVEAPIVDAEGKPTGDTQMIARDEGLRETSLEKLAQLKPVAREDGVHTAGTSSQVSDGASAVMLTTPERAEQLGLRPRARITHQCLVGVDPVTMLTGPIDATDKLLQRSGLTIDDFDLFEINEAFASVPLAWAKEVGADLERTNVNGGAIAIGHPLGASGARLITTALHELERIDGQRALISMCCGGGLGTGTIIERIA